MKNTKYLLNQIVSFVLTALIAVSGFVGVGMGQLTAAADSANEQAILTVDLDPAVNNGGIVHGAAGFLYGISAEGVPTTNTLAPLKPMVLATKGAVGTEHPYGDALDVAKTFLEGGGQQIQMYNNCYYGAFGVTATVDRYCDDLVAYVCPAVVAWKQAWNKEHGTPDNPKDNIGARIDIDKALVYVPINEGTPVGGNFNNAWKRYYDAIKSVDANASFAGPNDVTNWGRDYYVSYLQFCINNDCMPDVITWHELDVSYLSALSGHMADFKSAWNSVNWTRYNNLHGTTGIPELPMICINEYCEIEKVGVPGRLVNWIARLEDEKITGCLPFWHQANNLNDLASDANEGNGAWWLYKWYGEMSGNTQPVSSSTRYDGLYGLSAMDESKKISTTLFGGFTGDITVKINNVTDTETFKNAETVHITVQETGFSGFHGTAYDTPVIVEGAFSIDSDGSVSVKIPNTRFENAYNLTITQSSNDEVVNLPLVNSIGTVYEAENAALANGAAATAASTSPVYYMSEGGNGYRAADMPTRATLTYTINVPVDGKYRLDFNYGNGQGTVRNNMYSHNPVNVKQTFSLDGGTAQTVTMESTLFQTMTGAKTLYYDLTEGEHTVKITSLSGIISGMLLHDFLRVSYAGAYKKELPAFNKVYEAELADVNRLLSNNNSAVTTQTDIEGYSSGGYVVGLSDRSVENGGGIRYTVVVEQSGLYNIELRYNSSKAGKANIYVGNTAVTLDNLVSSPQLAANDEWQTAAGTVYLQKGINIIDIDTTVNAALDYMRVCALPSQDNSVTIEAEDTIPSALANSIKTATSEGASNGTYVVGMKGEYENPDYLEFTYDAPSDGKYQMQVFHSNEDLAGSHSYNIKVTDKYAVVEVNGQSDSPKFTLIDEEEAELLYFVDCGDHDPSTVSEGDDFGKYNSTTDRMYGVDSQTGYSWGIVMEDPREIETPGVSSIASSPNDKAIYTNYQKALSNIASDLLDGKPKEESLRYAHNQEYEGILPRYVSYKFEVEPAKYDITVCMGNSWGNASTPTVTASAEGAASVSADYSVGYMGNQVNKMTIDLTNAKTNSKGRVELSVRGSTTTPTIQMNYITISEHIEYEGGNYIILPPDDQKALAGEQLPEGIYAGKLAENKDWFIDYRNLKNETDRYFFKNTFSDDTFGEKTITLDLKKGKNTIRIYNDNSWNTTFGGSTSVPATESLPNYAPNFDKFIITPTALESVVQLDAVYNIDVSATEGVTAVSDVNSVTKGGQYTLTFRGDEGLSPVKLLINGIDMLDSAIHDKETGEYQLKVSNVNADQRSEIYFAKPDISKEALSELCESAEMYLNGDYSSVDIEALKTAIDNAKSVLNDENAAQWKINDAHDRLTDAIENLAYIGNLAYFVDCGDHDPSTVSEGDDFGKYNSTTDRMYGVDSQTGYSWGIVMEDPREIETPGVSSIASSPNDKAIYTNYQKALSNIASDLLDGKPKEESLRYAHNQEYEGILPRYVSYKFEVEPGEYTVKVGMSNTWNNAGTPTVTLSAAGAAAVSEGFNVAYNGTQEKTMTIDLSNAQTNDSGRVELSVRGSTTNPTIQMTHIIILSNKPQTDKSELFKAIADAEDIRVSSYTEESVDIFNAALLNAQRIYANDNATQQQIDSAVSVLTEAINGLVKKPADIGKITVSSDKASYVVNETITLTVVSSTAVRNIGITNTGTAKFIGKISQTYSDNGIMRTWTIVISLGSKGSRTLDIWATTDGFDYQKTDATVSFKVTAAQPQPVDTRLISVQPTILSANANEKMTMTVKTTLSATKIGVFNENGAGISSNKNYLDVGNERIWTVTFSVGSKGIRTLTVRAGDANGFTDNGKTDITAYIGRPAPSVGNAEIYSAEADKYNYDRGEQIVITAETSTATAKVGVFNENGAGISSNKSYSDVDGKRIWTIKLTVSTRGQRTLTVKASDGTAFVGDGCSVKVDIG